MYVRLQLRFGAKNPRAYRSGNRVVSVAYSLLLHAGVAFLLLVSPQRSPTDHPLYNSIIVPLEAQHKITYYNFRQRLPEVTPTDPDSAESKPDHPQLISPQTIVTAPRA